MSLFKTLYTNKSFNLPDALKWINHEPKYERKGDSLIISKVGSGEKKVVSLYLHPINCLDSSIYASVSFFDAKDRHQAVAMEPKEVSVICPIFSTKEDANVATLKKIRNILNHRDIKIFPIFDPQKSESIFSAVLSVLGKLDIKLVYKEYSDKLGEANF